MKTINISCRLTENDYEMLLGIQKKLMSDSAKIFETEVEISNSEVIRHLIRTSYDRILTKT